MTEYRIEKINGKYCAVFSIPSIKEVEKENKKNNPVKNIKKGKSDAQYWFEKWQEAMDILAKNKVGPFKYTITEKEKTEHKKEMILNSTFREGHFAANNIRNFVGLKSKTMEEERKRDKETKSVDKG